MDGISSNEDSTLVFSSDMDSIMNFYIQKSNAQCSLCSGSFDSKKILKMHVLTEHADNSIENVIIKDELFECPICREVFKSSQCLRGHYKVVHTQAVIPKKIFMCSTCNRKFTTKRNLHRHSVRFNNLCHPSFKRYRCNICFKKFPLNTELRDHFKAEHKNSNSVTEPVICPLCQQKSANRDTFIDHLTEKHAPKNNNSSNRQIRELSMLESRPKNDVKSSFSSLLPKNGEKAVITADSLDKTVKSWAEINSDHILYIKKKGNLDMEFSQLENDDFVLVVAESYQKYMLETRGNRVIILDTTKHFDICLGYDIAILSVFDELLREFPCVFMFASRRDEYVYHVLFEIIKKAVGELESVVFLSDVGNVYEKAWTSVMPAPGTFLFCSNSVMRVWDENLPKLGDAIKTRRVKDQLYALRTELNPLRFHERLESFLNENDKDLNEFKTKFIEQFTGNESKWAYCYRKHARVNTCSSVEIFVSTYRKLINIKSKPSNEIRLEEGLAVLGEMMRNVYEKRMAVDCLPKVYALKRYHRIALNNAHEKSAINKLTENSWYVSAVEGNDTMYLVERTNEPCDDCKLRCDLCEACIHDFICSCVDNCIGFNMCEHIHLICMYLRISKVMKMEESKPKRNSIND